MIRVLRRIPAWGWVVIAALTPCWLALLALFIAYSWVIAPVAVGVLLVLAVVRPRTKRIRITGTTKARTTVRTTTRPAGRSRSPYRP